MTDMYEWQAVVQSSTATGASVATATMDFASMRFRRDVTIEEVGRRLREAKWFAASLPCVVCGRALRNVFEAENQPSGGVAFSSVGHYGSTVFDPTWGMMGDRKHIEINICDACFMVACERGQILLLESSSQRPSVSASLYVLDE